MANTSQGLIAAQCAFLLGGALLVGCASTPDDPLPPDGSSSQQDQDGLSGRGVSARPGVDGQRGADAGYGSTSSVDAAAALENLIYFEFDSSVISERYQSVLDAHARELRAAPARRLRLEGHTDERGTREYNIALGERRGEAIRRALLLRGVPRAQLSVVSYGEENPVAYGSSEASWAQNRRVELNYLR